MLQGFTKMDFSNDDLYRTPKLTLRGNEAVFNKPCLNLLGHPKRVSIWCNDNGQLVVVADDNGDVSIYGNNIIARKQLKEWLKKYIKGKERVNGFCWQEQYIAGEYNEKEKCILFDTKNTILLDA